VTKLLKPIVSYPKTAHEVPFSKNNFIVSSFSEERLPRSNALAYFQSLGLQIPRVSSPYFFVFWLPLRNNLGATTLSIFFIKNNIPHPDSF